MSEAIGTSREAARANSEALESGATVALVAVAVGAFLLHAHYLPREAVDDAGISVAYARSVVEGAGFRVTPESAVAEGFSNPSWTLILIVLELLGVDSLTWVKPLGVALAALAFPLIALWGPTAEQRRLRLEDALAPLIAAAHPSFVHWAQGGLEMGLLVFAMALLGLFVLGPQTPRRACCTGLSASLVALTRPEGPLYAAALGTAWPLMTWVNRRRLSRRDLAGLACALVPVLAYLAFRRLYFGEWLPNTYFAKNPWNFFDTEGYFRLFWESYRPLGVATLWALPFAWLGGSRCAIRGFACAAAVAAISYFTYHAKGDWMMEWRFLAVMAPFQGACIGAGLSGLRRGIDQALSPFERVRTFAPSVQAALGILLTVHVIYHLIPSELARAEAVRSIGSDVPITIARGARYDRLDVLRPFQMAHPLILASDMGVIALGARHAELWDFAGLTDPSIARFFQRYEAFADYMENEGPPTLVLAWGPGNFFAASPIAQQRYAPLGAGAHLLKELTPEHDPRCPDGKQAVLALSRRALAWRIEQDARGREPVRALARWRCAYTYHTDARLPRRPQRARLGRTAEALGDGLPKRERELALRYYSLCAVIGMKNTPLTVRCRKKAETIRLALFQRNVAKPKPKPRPKKAK